MTNGWIDIKNTDMMLIMGGNPAENHPCGFKWAIEAKRTRNAKMIVVDPRFTRTAATSDLFCQIRAGADRGERVLASLSSPEGEATRRQASGRGSAAPVTAAADPLRPFGPLPPEGAES